MVLWTFAGNPTLDWDCDTSVQCVLNNYLAWFQSAPSGIPLMHAVKAGTAGAFLPPATRMMLAPVRQSLNAEQLLQSGSRALPQDSRSCTLSSLALRARSFPLP